VTATTHDSDEGGPHRAAWIGLLIAIGVGLVVVLRLLAPFASVLLLALVAAGMLTPWYRVLVTVLSGSRHGAALLICALLVVALLVPLFLTGREVSKEALAFYEMSTTQLTEQTLLEAMEQNKERLDQINRWLEPIGISVTPDVLYNQLASLGVELGAFFYRQGVSLAKELLRFVVGFLIWVMVVYYLLVDGDRVRGWFRSTIPIPVEQQDVLARRFTDMAGSLVVGNGVAATVQAIIGGFVFSFLDIPGPVLWAGVMWILAFIPVIGISFVYIPTWVVLLLAGQTGKAFGMLLPLIVVATVVEYWLKPMLVGRRAQLHTLLVFLSLLGGLEAFGAMGLLLGPLMMTAFLTLVSIYQEHYRPHLPLRLGGGVDAGEAPPAADDDGSNAE
jgi:predicted PurR-regulated permease PerM